MSKSRQQPKKVNGASKEDLTDTLLNDVRQLIEESRSAIATAVNVGMTMLYWRIGTRISEEILRGKRAGYGEEILATLSQQLTYEFGSGFSYPALTRMVRFVEIFPDERIVATLSQQLSWSHFKEIFPLQDPLQREFYAEMCRMERWSVRTLRRKIDSMLYERTALSHKPKELIQLELDNLRETDQLSPDLVLRGGSPYPFWPHAKTRRREEKQGVGAEALTKELWSISATQH